MTTRSTIPTIAVITGTLLVLVIPTGVWSAPPAEFSPEQDFIISAVEAGLKEMQTEFEISEPIETGLISMAVQGKFKGTSVLSITLIRPGMDEMPSRAFHKKFNEQFSMKMAKLTSSTVDNPIALVVVSTLMDGRIDVDQRILLWDGTKWGERRISSASK